MQVLLTESGYDSVHIYPSLCYWKDATQCQILNGFINFNGMSIHQGLYNG